jgi:UDP-N-acetylglucosamine--N-acetylmuramyl-(pentapeptide) pyrophosphoryl-undecaprenol N-acetylglucosamine transferase
LKNSIKHIVIAGSSGGHILPAIKYLNELSYHCSTEQTIFITNEVGADYLHLIEYEKKNVIQINSQNKTSFILKIIKEIWKILLFNKKITLLGFGGFITVPVLFFARITNILFFKDHKINFHEQNYVYGLANRFNYFIAHRVFTSFPNNYLKSKEIFVGNFFTNLEKKYEKLDNKLINILLIGGSAGSLELNKFLSNELLKIDRTLINNFKFYIQVPKKFLEEVSREYENLKLDIEFFTFNENLNFKDFDLIISRSGSGSLHEILYFNNKVYFIPHLHSRDGHQSLNLRYFKENSYSLKDFEMPISKKISKEYLNSLINPFSMQKILCYLTR